jgi:polysaccharide export outer membrane protein
MAAVMTRPSVKALEQERLDEYASRLEREIVQSTAMMAGGQSADELQAILNQQVELLRRMRNMQPVGRVVIDLNEPRYYENFIIENGDMLFVPRNLQTVSVIGEVFNPATFRFENDGRSVRHYVELSGGVKSTAKRRHAYVICANGSVVSRRMTNVMRYSLMPGDVVVVPQKLSVGAGYRRFANSLDTILKLTTIGSQTASTVLSFKLLSQ